MMREGNQMADIEAEILDRLLWIPSYVIFIPVEYGLIG